MEETTIVQRPLGDLRQSSQHTVSVLGTDQYIRDGTRVQHGKTYQEKLVDGSVDRVTRLVGKPEDLETRAQDHVFYFFCSTNDDLPTSILEKQ